MTVQLLCPAAKLGPPMAQPVPLSQSIHPMAGGDLISKTGDLSSPQSLLQPRGCVLGIVLSLPHNQMEEHARSIPDTLRPGLTCAHTYFGKMQTLCQALTALKVQNWNFFSLSNVSVFETVFLDGPRTRPPEPDKGQRRPDGIGNLKGF